MDKIQNTLVTGGGGFVGRKIVEMLLQRGAAVTVIGRNRYDDLEKKGVRVLTGDLADTSFIDQSMEGIDTVFHVAALAGIWGEWQLYHDTNVKGTDNVISACKKNQVVRLVYTSTPSVVFDGKDICDGDENLPYASTFLCNYAKSKAIAEKNVLEAGDDKLAVCAIRPHLVWGPEDPHLVPRLIEKGRKKKLKIIGDGTNMVDITYVDNVAHAHILAADNLAGEKTAHKKAYFIADSKPVRLWDWINQLYVQLDIAPVKQQVPFMLAYSLGYCLESIYTIARATAEPPMTRFVAEQLSKSHYFSHARATKDFGYKPIVTADEGMSNLLEWIKNEK